MLNPTLFLVFYIFTYILLCLFLIFTVKVRLSGPRFITISFILLISFVCGLRDQYVGTDTYTFYSLTKLMVSADSYLWAKDYVYYFFSRLGYQIAGYQLSVLLTTVITSSALALAVLRIIKISFKSDRSNNIIMTKTVCITLIFILMMSSSDFLMQIANQTRQIMALAIFILAITYFYENKYIIFSILTVLAIFSHHSLVLVILALIVSMTVKNIKIHFLILMGSFLLFATGISTHLLDAFGLGVSEGSIYAQALNSAASLYIKTVITIGLGLILYFLYYKKYGKYGHGFEFIFIRIYMMLASLSILYLGFAEASNRIQRYEGVIFPIILILISRKYRINALHIIVVLIISASYFSFMMSYYSTLKTLGFYSSEIKLL
ncbi:EpsG family protein [Rosenbergiella nectarea]|uniref:EpsG family protein n=2 Tax=Rosenbergiella nectarea TaxID=988801 RepID=UPI001F4D923A|nr:EpsG family protein [Rosenbergiella nectarea]